MYDSVFEVFPIIDTKRLLLRQLSETDIEDVYEYAKEREYFSYTDGFPHEYEELKAVINIWNNEAYNSKQFIRWAIELKEEKKVIGGIYLFSPHGSNVSGKRMDIGIEISAIYSNKGYASEAIRAISKFELKEMGLVRVQAQIVPENIASIRAFEKAGFKREGILRNYLHYVNNGDKLMTMVMMSVIQDDL